MKPDREAHVLIDDVELETATATIRNAESFLADTGLAVGDEVIVEPGLMRLITKRARVIAIEGDRLKLEGIS